MSTAYPIEIFQTEDGQISLEVQLSDETVWLSQAQLVVLFTRDQSVISRHVRNIFKEGELAKESNMQKMHIAGSDKPVAFYNLDVIIRVGYRVKSQRGVQFRQWATQTLKQHLIQGYTLNRKRLAQLGTDVDQLMGLMHKTLTQNKLVLPEGAAIADLIRDYARTWQLLLAYDERKLDEPDGQKHELVLDARIVRQAIHQLKTRLKRNGQATDLFGRERNHCHDTTLTCAMRVISLRRRKPEKRISHRGDAKNAKRDNTLDFFWPSANVNRFDSWIYLKQKLKYLFLSSSWRLCGFA